jgi:hypothetical protein
LFRIKHTKHTGSTRRCGAPLRSKSEPMAVEPTATKWRTVEAFLKARGLDADKHARAWKAAFYVWSTHKVGIVAVVGLPTGAILLPFDNEAFDNRLCWPATAPSTFVLDGQVFSTPQEYYKAKQERYGIVEGPEGVLEAPTSWWLNGHLVCNTKGPWGTRGLDKIAAALSSIRLPHAKVVIVNRRDMPLRPADVRMSPLLWSAQACAGYEKPLFYGLAADQLTPILSFYGGPSFSDSLWPPPEHWTLASELATVSWHLVPKTIHKAVFRGTLTGLHMDHRSVRLSLAQLQALRPDILDAGLTAWSPRDRIRLGGSATGASGAATSSTVVSYSGPPDMLALVGPLTPAEQAAYKIIVYAPGHCASLRLGWHLLTGCAIVVIRDPTCTCELQWLNLLEVPGMGRLLPGTHYIETTMDRLLETIQGLLADPAMCKKLGQAAHAWATMAFQPGLMAAYTASLLGA